MKFFAGLVAFLASIQAHAIYTTEVADYTDYQIGDEWGKLTVTPELLKHHDSAYIRAAVATARVGGATGFYLGKFNGHHMMATNHHVMPGNRFCAGHGKVTFPILGKQFECEKFYGDWTAIDLALFEIRVESPEDERQLARVGRNFNFKFELRPGQDLITIGFGVFRNSARKLMGNDDRDCKVFSGRGDYRFIADPDRINPADYKTWSFAVGCDVSHGDSGSAIVDRQSGDVVGIIWTTSTQKPERIRSSSYLDELLNRQGEDIWNWLSYAVPAPKMKSFLMSELERGAFPDGEMERTVRYLLEN